MADANVLAWLQILALGGIAGAMGQGTRVLVGIKKLQDAASTTPGSTAADKFQPGRLVVSLLIGFIAGGVAAMTILRPDGAVTPQVILGIAAAGYAGTDFIEGFVRRIDGSAANGGATNGGATPAQSPAAPSPDGAVG